MRQKKFFLAVCSIILIFALSTGIGMAFGAGEGANGGKEEGVAENEIFTENISVKPYIVGGKYLLEYPEIQEKQWYEYVEYEASPYSTFYSDDKTIQYKVFLPEDYSSSCIMEATAYTPDNLSADNTKLGINWTEYVNFFAGVAIGNVAVGLNGGIVSAISGGIAQEMVAGFGIGSLYNNAKYYSDEYYTGLPNDGFYSMDSMTITIQNSENFSISKSTGLNYSISTGGSSEVEGD